MSTQTTFNHAEVKPLLQKLKEAKAKSKAEERTALKNVENLNVHWQVANLVGVTPVVMKILSRQQDAV